MRFWGFIRDGVEDDSGEIRHKVGCFSPQRLLPTHFSNPKRRMEFPVTTFQHIDMTTDEGFFIPTFSFFCASIFAPSSTIPLFIFFLYKDFSYLG
jgi:hypothetical protein